MRELLKPFVMRYGSTRVEVAMEIRFEKKKKRKRKHFGLLSPHLQLSGPSSFVETMSSYVSDGGWG